MVSESHWNTGNLSRTTGPREVLFGRVYEDAHIECSVFARGTRVFCIASAGCTAIQLSAGREVIAVDLNPAQLDYARRRSEGAPAQAGVAERRMAAARRFLPLFGWTRRKIELFLGLDRPARQMQFWNDHLNTRVMRWTLDSLLSGSALRLGYRSALLSCLPPRFGRVLRARLERGWAAHPNRANGYARALLNGGLPLEAKAAPGSPIAFVWADAAAYLEACPSGSFDGFALSNILDGCTPQYRLRLQAAIRHAGSKGSLIVRRSFSEPRPALKNNLAERDRSLLWGVVEVLPTDQEL